LAIYPELLIEEKQMSNTKHYEIQNLPKGECTAVLKGSEPSETKIPTKKQTVYLIMQDMSVKTEQGYIIDLTNTKGQTTKIALLCKGKRWFATHYETGLDCTPRTKESGEVCNSWKRDELIAILKELDLDFETIIARDLFKQKCIDKIEEFKRSVQDQ
jgi:hypothetical protein